MLLQYESGRFSPYGDELYPLLKYLAEEGHMDKGGWTKASQALNEVVKCRGSGHFLIPSNSRLDSTFLQYLAYYYMGYRGRLNKSSKAMVEKFNAGQQWPVTGSEEDSQANSLVKVGLRDERACGK